MKTLLLSAFFIALIGCDLSPPGTAAPPGDEDPSCDYNDGVKNSQGFSTCNNMDYKTKVHGDEGKTIDAHCENGYVAGASMVSSDDICFDDKEDHEQNFDNCAKTQTSTYCGWKWSNGCATTHHITTKSITCAPLAIGLPQLINSTLIRAHI